MLRDEQIRVLEGLMAHLDAGTNVDAGGQMHNPVDTYTDPERAKREWDELFLNYPGVVGLSSDLPAPACFFTNEDLGKPILCTRDQGGTFHAFLNVCRHRGTVVETEERGKKSVFSCPFHGWGYNVSGELVAVPQEAQFGAVDRTCHSLVPLPAQERHGLLVVSANPEQTFDIDELLGDLGAELANWRLGETQRLSESRFDHAMNWKLAIDTFGETYHFNTLHRDTLAHDFYGNCQMYDTYERNHRMVLCLKNIDTLRDRAQDQWHVLLGGLPVYYLFPNVQLIIGVEGPTLVRVYPNKDDPHDSYSRIDFYLQAEALVDSPVAAEARERDRRSAQERMEGFANVIQAEDYVAAASSHRGARSGALDFVTFGRNEPALHHYHNTYREALGLPRLKVIAE